ncbi:hypothetical protein [Achromobacter xylosoxidans]|uniref:hypothetical protein n=1 Tax=Alcaligenes xylosoxydans xylosoxydans TaxID=85698 RepID=UPI001F13523D|nr:hypothetical protein [Achromobacter xylosoxidans]
MVSSRAASSSVGAVVAGLAGAASADENSRRILPSSDGAGSAAGVAAVAGAAPPTAARTISAKRLMRARPGSKRLLMAYSRVRRCGSSSSRPSAIKDAHNCGSPDISKR